MSSPGKPWSEEVETVTTPHVMYMTLVVVCVSMKLDWCAVLVKFLACSLQDLESVQL